MTFSNRIIGRRGVAPAGAAGAPANPNDFVLRFRVMGSGAGHSTLERKRSSAPPDSHACAGASPVRRLRRARVGVCGATSGFEASRRRDPTASTSPTGTPPRPTERCGARPMPATVARPVQPTRAPVDPGRPLPVPGNRAAGGRARAARTARTDVVAGHEAHARPGHRRGTRVPTARTRRRPRWPAPSRPTGRRSGDRSRAPPEIRRSRPDERHPAARGLVDFCAPTRHRRPRCTRTRTSAVSACTSRRPRASSSTHAGHPTHGDSRRARQRFDARRPPPLAPTPAAA